MSRTNDTRSLLLTYSVPTLEHPTFTSRGSHTIPNVQRTDHDPRIQTVSNWLVPYVFLLNATVHAFGTSANTSRTGASESTFDGLRPQHPTRLALATAAAQPRESISATITFAEALLATRRALVALHDPAYDSDLAIKYVRWEY